MQFDAKRGQGLISGQDGVRYSFQGVEFQNAINELSDGVDVDFEVIREEARSIFIVKNQYVGQSESKSKLAAGLFAILLGGLGVHKFYLGHTIPGVILLLVSVFGWALMFIPNLVVGVIVLIEGIIYLTKSDRDFQKIYVINKKIWF
mgnify:CR=1 FL=1